ncbi:MAG: MarR family transcriptional regulator [Anaerolineaceae bacterium]|jgi:DNA-binding MarR family transcriptional regulator|nr:MarR family transcriptional regulator [Anaerolineaceae bacterium]MDD4042591.1 MarR family transcriptional regulator [Anaerolineaceae bacterium]MDD4577224.1 MarR family transcriptional regulator [Anaerolineaceae bacterium]
MKKEDFIWELWNLTRELQRSRLGLCFEFCKKYDLTQQQVRILLQIKANESTTLTELAEVLDINPGNLSKTCKVLEEKGFIQRTRHDEDKRVWTIVLDELGITATDEIAQHIQDVFTVFSKKHKSEDLESLLALLREYADFYHDLITKK